MPVTPRTLKRGMSGPEVADLQRLLTAAGFHCEPDGVFGAVTLAAVREYQGEHGLPVDGKAGPRTMAALRGQPTSDPPAVEIWGVDVAEFNSPDVPAIAAAGCSFAVLRCMTGSDPKGIMRADSKVHSHYAAFRTAGIPVIGFYAWIVASRAGVEQARLALDVVKDYPGFVAVDHEPAKGAVFRDPIGATNAAMGFTSEIACRGRSSPVYTAPYALASAPLPALGDRPLWLAHPGLSHWPAPIAPWSVVTLWQCGYVDPEAPEAKKIDKNVYRGSLVDLRRELGA